MIRNTILLCLGMAATPLMVRAADTIVLQMYG